MTLPERVEVYVDDATAPAHVLSVPPFQINLDTTALPDGEHTVRVITRFPGGRSRERRFGIVVSNGEGPPPEVVVEGLTDGGRVSGVVHATVTVPSSVRVPRARSSMVLYPLVAAVALVGVWAVFALTLPPLPPSGTGTSTSTAASPPSPAPAPTGTATVSASSGGTSNPAAAEFQLQGCVGCHMVAGKGGTVGMDLTHIGAKISRARLTVVITQGEGQMPAYPKLKPADLNALLDYLLSLK